MIPVRPEDRCELCGANLALVGRVHRCVPRAAAVVPTPAKPKPKPALVASPQRGTGRMPSRSIGSLTIVPTSATTCASAEQMPSLPPTWLAALWQRLLPPKRNTKPLTSQMPLGGRRRGVLRRRRDLDPERLAQPQRPGLFHNPLPQLLLSHAGKLHRPLATLQDIRDLFPVLDRRQLR